MRKMLFSGKKWAFLIALAVAAFFSGLFLVGCGDNKNPVGPIDSGKDSRLINVEGEAWIYNDYLDGYVFLPDGVLREIYYDGSVDGDDGEHYYYVDNNHYTRLWSTKENSDLVVTDRMEYDYTVSNDTFTIVEDGEEVPLTKMTGMTIYIAGESHGGNPAGTRDSRLVTGTGEAWVGCFGGAGDAYEECVGVVIRSDGNWISIEQKDDAWFGRGDAGMSWSTKGNSTLIVTLEEIAPYAILGDDLVIRWPDYENDRAYTKRGGLTITAWKPNEEEEASMAKRRGSSRLSRLLMGR